MKSIHNIKLVSSMHNSVGNCNCFELYQIIDHIVPFVIFEEIPPALFDSYHIDKSLSSLETHTINRYIENNPNHTIDQIPIDPEIFPSEEFLQDYQHMIRKIEGLTDVNGFTYRNLVDFNKWNIDKYGFRYLNSRESININNEINSAIKNSLQKINDDKLFQTFKKWNSIQEMRENRMLQNIYTYSKKHNYRRAVFILEASHRNSIIEKISEFQKNETIKLNWFF